MSLNSQRARIEQTSAQQAEKPVTFLLLQPSPPSSPSPSPSPSPPSPWPPATHGPPLTFCLLRHLFLVPARARRFHLLILHHWGEGGLLAGGSRGFLLLPPCIPLLLLGHRDSSRSGLGPGLSAQNLPVPQTSPQLRGTAIPATWSGRRPSPSRPTAGAERASGYFYPGLYSSFMAQIPGVPRHPSRTGEKGLPLPEDTPRWLRAL